MRCLARARGLLVLALIGPEGPSMTTYTPTTVALAP